MSLNKNSLLCFFFTALALFSRGQDRSPEKQDSLPTQNLEAVVVTATRTLRQLSSLPLPVTLIDRTQIERTGVTRLNEILQEQTGIVMVPDATVGGGEGVQIQGIASDYILVLIDGVPVVGRSSGNLDLSRFAVGNIQQIEVVKGPSSSLFGSEALGGVINIITDRPASGTFAGEVSHRWATFNHQNTNARLSKGGEQLGYSLYVDRLSTDGYDLSPDADGQTVNPFFNYTVNGTLYVDVSEQLEFFFSGRFFQQEFDVEPSTSEEQDMNVLWRAQHRTSPSSEFQYELYFTRYRTDEQTVDPISQELLIANDFDQRMWRPEIRWTRQWGERHALIVGAGYQGEILDRSLFSEEISFDSHYGFAQFDWSPMDRLNLILGARYDVHSVYNAQLSPKVSARWELGDRWAVRASVGSGFKAPDFRQLYLDFTNAAGGGYSVFGKEVEARGLQQLEQNGEIASLLVSSDELGDPLEAESSVGYNLGVTYRRQRLTAEFNAFRNDIRNLIDTRILAAKTNGQNVFGYINRDRVYTQGLELDLKYRPWESLELSAGYQLLYAFDKQREDEIRRGEVFARDPETLQTVQLERSDYFGLENRSRHTLNAKAFLRVPRWDAHASLRAVYRSRFGLADRNGNGLLDPWDDSFVPGYTLLNLALGKTFYKQYELQLGANNLLDFRGENPLAAGESTLFIQPGIQIFTRLNIHF